MATGDYPHISRDENNVLVITGTRIKVVLLVGNHLAHGFNAEELQRQYPFLTLGQIHSALAYYYDHREEINQEIERRRRLAEELRPQLEDAALVERLRRQKRERSQS